mmetsp:Transcript_10237/g.17822  ORF Transcript_10237/g.17822 Transcript_10237/m.17822 type:complete len:224 (-) Transcript_10237:786-1457(-)
MDSWLDTPLEVGCMGGALALAAGGRAGLSTSSSSSQLKSISLVGSRSAAGALNPEEKPESSISCRGRLGDWPASTGARPRLGRSSLHVLNRCPRSPPSGAQLSPSPAGTTATFGREVPPSLPFMWPKILAPGGAGKGSARFMKEGVEERESGVGAAVAMLLCDASPSCRRATPKSAKRAMPWAVSRMFEGLTSRCTSGAMPPGLAARYTSASATSRSRDSSTK